MFITQPKEIMEACPTARLDTKDAQRLIRGIEEEEQQMLEPLIGEDLMLQLAQQYRDWVSTFGGITTDKIDAISEENVEPEKWSLMQKTIPLLRDIQSALVYRMFANKIYTISTSLNLGGGANRASAGDYDPADDKHLRELRSEFWMNSIHACDNILYKLEKDAKFYDAEDNKSLWYDLWKESDGFFMKEDSLFPTMRELKKFYPCDQPTRFLAIQPVLMYCQNTYIAPRVNAICDGLLDRLVDPCATLTPEEQRAKKLLRVALSYHMQAHQAAKSSAKNATPFSSAPGIYSISPDKTEMIQSADSALSTAIDYIEKHLTSSAGAEAPTDDSNSQSPLPNPQSPPPNTTSSTRCNAFPGHESHKPTTDMTAGEYLDALQCGCGCSKGGGSDSEYTTFSTLGMPGLNRW